MIEMTVFSEDIEVQLAAGMDMEDITGKLESLVTASKIKNGILSATITGSTGSLTTIEHEPGVIEDLRGAIKRMTPPDIEYEHEKAWHDGNGHSHVQAAIIGPSICMQIRGGKMLHGTWQQLVAINHDNRSRRRKIAVTIIGEQ
ncbi:MAG: secondary thiamine-phosphate synthase enzyme YjbQ [Desulfobacteraceae bacterium]|nr:secondary thiamine-phosphate synthase enzyme YjbQ [Desulfobacteraceae bacterium]